MVKVLSCLLVLGIVCSFCLVSSEEVNRVPPISLKELLTYIPDGYDIDSYISRTNEKVLIDDLTFTMQEIAADPNMLWTLIKCDCSDPNTELRAWFGLDSDLHDVLNYLHESKDHDIVYINITPISPFEEQALDAVLQDNSLYRWSGSTRSNNELTKCTLNQAYTISEDFLIDVIRMESGKWNREINQVSFSIPILPVVDKFELATPIELPQYDFIIKTANVYLTPIDAYIIRSYDSISSEKLLYHLFINGNPDIELAEKLPDTIIISIIDDSKEVVYREEWIRNDKTLLYKKVE